MSRLPGDFTRPANGLLLYYGNPRAIHLHIQDSNGFTDHDRQMQLYGTRHFGALTSGEIFADAFGGTLHSLGGEFESGEQFHVLTVVSERRFGTNQGEHPAYTRRQLFVFDIKFRIERKLPLSADRAEEVRTADFHLAQTRKNVAGTQVTVARGLAAGTRASALPRSGRIAAQQLTQTCRARLVKGSTEGHFDGFHIELAIPLKVPNHQMHDGVYFARDFCPDDFGSFFSCGVRLSSTGRI